MAAKESYKGSADATAAVACLAASSAFAFARTPAGGGALAAVAFLGGPSSRFGGGGLTPLGFASVTAGAAAVAGDVGDAGTAGDVGEVTVAGVPGTVSAAAGAVPDATAAAGAVDSVMYTAVYFGARKCELCAGGD
jgi:hypothetical protein